MQVKSPDFENSSPLLTLGRCTLSQVGSKFTTYLFCYDQVTSLPKDYSVAAVSPSLPYYIFIYYFYFRQYL